MTRFGKGTSGRRYLEMKGCQRTDVCMERKDSRSRVRLEPVGVEIFWRGAFVQLMLSALFLSYSFEEK